MESAPNDAVTVGDKVGRYLLGECIGEGGMATVFLGEHEVLQHEVAIKVLHPRHSHDRDMERRFFNEARAIASLNHPGIVTLFDVGRADDGSAYLVMELLRGETLGRRLQQGGVSIDEAVVFGRQIASALGAAHDAGIVHRDLKPDNVFIVEDDDVPGGLRTKVLDFGIAKRSEVSGPITRTGVLLGTPTYMAPEQSAGDRDCALDGRVDIYSVGVVLFQMLSGRMPYEAARTEELMAQQLHCAPRDLRTLASHVPPGLAAAVMRCLAPEPDDRFEDMAALARALEQAQGEPASANDAESQVRTGLWGAPETRLRTVARPRSQGRQGPGATVGRAVALLGVAGAAALAVVIAASLVRGDDRSVRLPFASQRAAPSAEEAARASSARPVDDRRAAATRDPAPRAGARGSANRRERGRRAMKGRAGGARGRMSGPARGGRGRLDAVTRADSAKGVEDGAPPAAY